MIDLISFVFNMKKVPVIAQLFSVFLVFSSFSHSCQLDFISVFSGTLHPDCSHGCIQQLQSFNGSSSFQVKSQYTTGAASRSFTSTSFDPVTKNEYEYVKVEKNPKKKGYVQLHTTHGDLNIELHCDIAPRACENFITLCERGYYNGVAFHRSIRYSDLLSLIL